MNRREFIQLMLITSAVTATTACHHTSNNQQPETIVIVGAGMAGISAARHLHDAGHTVILLEGRHRIGGRVWTSRKWDNTPLDMGASWIHGERGNPMTQLANQINTPRQASDHENWLLYDTAGNLQSAKTWRQMEQFGTQIVAALEAAAELEQDISVAAAIAAHIKLDSLSTAEKKLFNTMLNYQLEQEWAADSHVLSAHYIDEGREFGGNDMVFLQGYDVLIDYLATGLDIRLNQQVTHISYRETDVTVETQHETFAADRVLVTLPIGLLKRGEVTFEPQLPAEKQAAIGAIGVSVLNKVYLQFPRLFWPPAPDWIGYIPDVKGEFSAWLNIYRYTGQPILAAFNGGDFGTAIETLSDREIVDRAMQTLRILYGTTIPEPTDVQITRWFTDPFARCSYSHPAVGMTTKTRAELAAPLGERVFFAGEATHSDYPATVHGAYLSGQREAKRIRQLAHAAA